MEIISLNSSNFEYFVDRIQEFVKQVNNSEIEALFKNKNHSMQCLSAGIEQSILAVENNEIVGMLAAFSNVQHSIWSLAMIYVNEEKRLQSIGSTLMDEFEKHITDNEKGCKVTAQCKKNDKNSNIFFLSKFFDFEGWCRAADEKDDMYVWGKIYR